MEWNGRKIRPVGNVIKKKDFDFQDALKPLGEKRNNGFVWIPIGQFGSVLNPSSPTPEPQTPGIFNFVISEIAGDILISGSGFFNTSSLTIGESYSSFGSYGLVPDYGFMYVGDVSVPYDGWVTDTFNVPNNFGIGVGTYDAGYTNQNGQIVGLLTFNDQYELVLPQGYINGNIITVQSVLQSLTFDDIGVTPGTYTWTLGEGDTMNTITAEFSTSSITGYTGYSQTLSLPLNNISCGFECDGTTIESQVSLTSASTIQDIVDYFNSDPNFSQYGVYFDNGDDVVGIEMPWSFQQTICPFGELTLNIYEDSPITFSLYRAFNESPTTFAVIEYLDPQYEPTTLTAYPESLYDFCAIIDSPQVVSGDTSVYYYSNCNEPPVSNAPCACAQWDVLNSDLDIYPSRSFTYVDCDGNTQYETLGQGQNITVCGCASSFSEEGGTGYLFIGNQQYDICPMGTVGFDDRTVSIYGNYLVRNLRYDTDTYYGYTNFNGQTFTQQQLKPGAIIELTGVLVGSLSSATMNWLVEYQGAYVPPVLYKILVNNCSPPFNSYYVNSPVDSTGFYEYTMSINNGDCVFSETGYGPTDDYNLPLVVSYWQDGGSCNCNQ